MTVDIGKKMLTGLDVKDSVLKNKINYIPHHNCSFCESEVGYEVHGEDLYFNGSCACSYSRSQIQPRSWESAAAWINMQTNENERIEIMGRFGILVNDR